MMGAGGGPSWRGGVEAIFPSQPVFSLWQPSLQSQMEGWLRVTGLWQLQVSKQMSLEELRPLQAWPLLQSPFSLDCPVLTELY